MISSVHPMTSMPEPVAAHDSEFRYLPVRRYGDAQVERSAAARQPSDGALAPDAVNAGSLGALTAFAPLRPAEFVIVRLAQHLAADEGHSG
jgi:hypothetical protein